MTQDNFVNINDPKANVFLLSMSNLTTFGTLVFLGCCYFAMIVGTLLYRHYKQKTLRPWATFFLNTFLAFITFLISTELNIIQMETSLLGMLAISVVFGLSADKTASALINWSESNSFFDGIKKKLGTIKGDKNDSKN